MTPADRAMKNAFDESVRFARSPSSIASAATPVLPRQPRRNVTSSELQPHQLPENVRGPFDRSPTPHQTLRQSRKFQQSPAHSLSPDLDFKRVRRKPSFPHLSEVPFESTSSPAPTTSSLPSVHSAPSHHKFSPSPLLPPLPLTPVPRPSTTSPSLSSTVDTLQSTPSHSPTQPGSSTFEPWRVRDRFELAEPIRTKRKFLQFKQAKRLPHSTSQQGGGGRQWQWQVHAAVIDIGDIGTGSPDSVAYWTPGVRANGPRSPLEEPGLQSSGKKSRTVRFKDPDTETDFEADYPRESHARRSVKEQESSLASSFSLSKYQFPDPPSRRWAGTFGHLHEPTPPTSPATLLYRGASFDVVNPHESLLLGTSDFETPAEVEGLLEDYFHSRHELSSILPFDEFSAEMDSSSERSVSRGNGNGRRQILYDDADSARRGVMGLERSCSQPASGNHDSSGTGLSQQDLPSSSAIPGASIASRSPYHDSEAEYEAPRGLQIHPNLREALGVTYSSPTNRLASDVGFEDVETHGRAQGATGDMSAGEVEGDVNINEQGQAAVNRDSSIYPHSQRSDPFPLSVSDCDDEEHKKIAFENIDRVVGRGRSSYFASDDARNEQEGNLAVTEDETDSATQSTSGHETTVDNILGHYNYPREPLSPREAAEERRTIHEALRTSSSVPELGRGYAGTEDPFHTPIQGSQYNVEQGSFEDPRAASRMDRPPQFNFGNPRPARRPTDPPNSPVPVPPGIRAEMRSMGKNRPSDIRQGIRSIGQHHPGSPEPQTSDQTYGSTGDLLGLTPEEKRILETDRPRAPSPSGRRYPEVRWPLLDQEEEGEDDEHYSTRALFTSRSTDGNLRVAPQHVLRSSSVYPDDDSVWESVGSDSRTNLAEHNTRPSQESYANTSIYGNRLSAPTGVDGALENLSSPFVDPPGTYAGRVLELASRSPVEDEVEPTPDERRAFELLETKYQVKSSPTLSLKRSKEEDMKELEELRQKNSHAVQKAADLVSQKLGINIPPSKGKGPQRGFTKASHIGNIQQAHASTSSETQGLLQHAQSPYTSEGYSTLQYNESTGTVQTTRTHRTPGRAVATSAPFNSPITPLSPAVIHDREFDGRDFARAAQFTPSRATQITEDVGLETLTRQPRRTPASRPAMSSQTSLHPLHLARSQTGSIMSGPMTDAQLLEAEPTWTSRPDFGPDGAIRRHAIPTSFGIEQADGSVEHTRLLSAPREGRNISTRRMQKELTKKYFRLCNLFPLTALLFGFGGLDWRMRQMTNGRITEMWPPAKRESLTIFLPLNVMVWTIIGIVIVISALA